MPEPAPERTPPDDTTPVAEGSYEWYRRKVERLQSLIRDLADDEPCWFDHHGGCQAHGYLSLEPGERCPQGEAQELVAALDAAEEERS